MILLYHKVAAEVLTKWWVSADTFYRQMAGLRGRKVVYLDDYDCADPNHVCITFDGVYENVHTFAAPILEQFGYPYELFLVSGSIGHSNEFDTEEPAARFANAVQLSDMVRRGGRLQWHTRHHLRLTDDIPLTKLRSELRIPPKLRQMDQRGFRWIAYPHGEFTKRTIEESKALFMGGLSCNQGNGISPFEINRTIVTEDSTLTARKVGVIIPSYNYGNFLAEAAESALRQTVPPDQILIVDDASTDDTELIGRAVQESHSDLVTFVRNETNLGIVGTFNKAVEMMETDYVVFLGADNRFVSNYLEKCAEALDLDKSVGVAYTDFALFGPRAPVVHGQFPQKMRGEIVGNTFWLIHFPERPEEIVRSMTAGDENVIHGSSMFRRQAWAEAGGYRKFNEYPEDFDLFRRILQAGWKPSKARGTYLEYRHHSSEQANAALQSATSIRILKESLVSLRAEAEEKAKHVALLQRENEERTSQVIHFKGEAEEKSKHVTLLQRDLEERSQQVTHFQREFEDKSKHVTLLQRDLEEKSQQVAHFQREAGEESKRVTQLQRENDQQSKLLAQLKEQLELSGDRLARIRDELLDARWEVLTLRGTLLRRTESAETPASRDLELENRVETATSERDHLRNMLTSLQKDLELERVAGQSQQNELRATQAQLRATLKDLRSAQQQMDRLRESISRKLILPFGKSQRKLQQLTTSRRTDD
jgi:GT2 family glycosyltransferase